MPVSVLFRRSSVCACLAFAPRGLGFRLALRGAGLRFRFTILFRAGWFGLRAGFAARFAAVSDIPARPLKNDSGSVHDAMDWRPTGRTFFQRFILHRLPNFKTVLVVAFIVIGGHRGE